jgi:serine/threonine-protein kinase RsbW
VIRVKLPGLLEYRDLAIRMVASACKLVHTRRREQLGTGPFPRVDTTFDAEVISAFSEAFNNIALHSYERRGGDLEIEIETEADGIVIRLLDYGKSYDFSQVPEPDLEALPESGLGIYIMRSCMDDVTYAIGRPNVLTMTKKLVTEPTVAGDVAGD